VSKCQAYTSIKDKSYRGRNPNCRRRKKKIQQNVPISIFYALNHRIQQKSSTTSSHQYQPHIPSKSKKDLPCLEDVTKVQDSAMESPLQASQ